MAENELTAVSSIGGKPVKMSGINVEVIHGNYCVSTPENPIDYIYEEYQGAPPGHVLGNNGLMGLGIGYTDDQEGTHFWRGYVGNTGCDGKLVYAKYDLETSAFDEDTTETIVTNRQFDYDYYGSYITGYNGTPIKSEAFAFRDEEYGYIIRESELGRTVLVVEHSYGYPTNEPEHFILNNETEGGIFHYAAVFEDLDFNSLNYRDFYIDTSDPSNRVVIGSETYWKVQMNDHSIGGGTSLTAGIDLKINNDIISVNTDGIVDNLDEMSFVAGSGTYASGYGAAAFGISASAIGIGTFAEGYKTSAFGDYSHAEGDRTTALGKRSYAGGVLTLADGDCAHTEGEFTHASGKNSHAEGDRTYAYGNMSHTEGASNHAYGVASHAECAGTMASGDYSHTEGYQTRTFASASHAEGYWTHASAVDSHTEGCGTLTLGKCSHAEGYSAIASGQNSHAEGSVTHANYVNSHAEGQGTVANGWASHAEGMNTTAEGAECHAEGFSSVAFGDHSHAEGRQTSAAGDESHAEGSNTSAVGDWSHAGGYYTVASDDAMTVIGKWNNIDSAAFVIGNGSWNNRSDAFIIDWEGNVSAAGKVFTSGIELAGGNASLNKVYFDNDGVSAYDNSNSEYVTISWYDLITAVGGTHHPV